MKKIVCVLPLIVFLLASCHLGLADSPSTNVEPGVVAAGSDVVLTTSIKNALIHYTVDGSDPTVNSTVYSTPIRITKNTTIKAVAVKSDRIVSEMMVAEYLVKSKKPKVSIAAGTYDSSQSVSISCDTVGVSFYYTLNGDDPATSSQKYSSPIAISKNTTLKVIAASDDFHASDVLTAEYKIKTSKPTSSLASNKYGTAQAVTLSCSSSGAKIYYTLDGTTPTDSSTEYISSFNLSSVLPVSKTLKIVAKAQDCEPSDVAEYVYVLYTIGPAGGYVFYDCDADNDATNNGAGPDGLKSSECNWRYMEISPNCVKVGTESRFVFGYYMTSPAGDTLFVNGGKYTYTEGTSDPDDGKCTGTAIGTGRANTIKLVTAMGSGAYLDYPWTDTTADYAAKLCYDYSYGGYSDWFLPSMEELNQVMINLEANRIGSHGMAWSSSEGSATHNARTVNSSYSTSGPLYSDGSYDRSATFLVYPVRAFMTL